MVARWVIALVFASAAAAVGEPLSGGNLHVSSPQLFVAAPLAPPFLVQENGAEPRVAARVKTGEHFLCLEAAPLQLTGATLDFHAAGSGILKNEREVLLLQGELAWTTPAKADATRARVSFPRGAVVLTGSGNLWLSPAGALRCICSSGAKLRIMTGGLSVFLDQGELLAVDGSRAVVFAVNPQELPARLDLELGDLLQRHRLLRDSAAATSGRALETQEFFDSDPLGDQADHARAGARRYGLHPHFAARRNL